MCNFADERIRLRGMTITGKSSPDSDTFLIHENNETISACPHKQAKQEGYSMCDDVVLIDVNIGRYVRNVNISVLNVRRNDYFITLCEIQVFAGCSNTVRKYHELMKFKYSVVVQ